MSTLSGLVKSAVLLLSVPLIGWASAGRVTAVLRSDCAPGAESICDTLLHMRLLRDASTGSALVVVALLAAIALASWLCRGNQQRLALVFGLQIRLTLLVLAGLVLVQGAILTYSVWIVGAVVFHLINIYGLAFMGFGTIAACGAMLWSLATMTLRPVGAALAVPVSRKTQPRLWRFIDALALAVGTAPPDTILVGLAPHFYVCDSKTRLAGTKQFVSGETMYLSASAMRILSEDELGAIVAHELAHFQAADTRYSRAFLPIYRGLEAAIRQLTGRRDLWSLALLPTVSVLGFAHGQFSRAERSISRAREFAADRTAARVAGPRPVVSALVKLGTLSPAWPQMEDLAFSLLSQDRALTNISASFAEHARHLLDDTSAEVLLDRIVSVQQPHPIDTHPTLEARSQALGVPLDDAPALIRRDSLAASDLLDGLVELETLLTSHANRMMAARTRPAFG
jgi:Zn-dependent protease with chaperone function